MEFTKHYHDVHDALDPDNLATRERGYADTLEEETEREIRKHPEKKEEKEAYASGPSKGCRGYDRVPENPQPADRDT